MITRLEYGPDNERSAAEHHAWAHAVETDLIVTGQISEQASQWGHRYGTNALEHSHQAIARANAIRAKYIGQQHGHQHVPTAQAQAVDSGRQADQDEGFCEGNCEYS